MRTRFSSVYAIGPILAGCLALGACSHTVRTYDQSMAPPPNAPVKEVSAEQVSKSLIRVADSLRENGEYKTAVGVYTRAMASDSKDPALPLGLAQSLWALGDWEDAGRAFEQAHALDPTNKEARIGVGNALLATGRLDEAVTEFNTLIAAMPEEPRVYNGLGVAYDLQGKHKDAQLRYGLGLEVAPKDVATKNNLAVSFALAKDYSTAIELLKGMPDTPKTRQNLALVYGLANEPKEAAEMARKDLDEKDVENNLGYYAWLRGLSGKDQAEAVLLGHSTETETQTAETKTPSVAEAEPSPPAVPAVPAEVMPLPAPKSVMRHVPQESSPVVQTAEKPQEMASASKPDQAPIPEIPPTPGFGTGNAPDIVKDEAPASSERTPPVVTVTAQALPEHVVVSAAPLPHSIDIPSPAALSEAAPQPVEITLEPKESAEVQKVAQVAPRPKPARKLYQAQLASFPTLAETEGEKKKLVRRHGDLLNGVDLVIEEADLGPAKGTFHRLRTAPAADKEEPRSLCNALKATGVACYVIQVTDVSPTKEHPQG